MTVTDNTVVIDAPFELVWELTNDVANWTTLFTEYAASEVLERDGSSLTFRLTTVPDPDGSSWSWTSRRTLDRAARRTVSERIETGPFEYMTIVWDYTETEAGIALRWRQDFTVKAAAPFDDAAMKQRLDATTLVQQAVIKARIEGYARGLERAGSGIAPWRVGLAEGRPQQHADALVLLTCGDRLASIVSALAQVGVADALAAGPLSPAALADATGTHPGALLRALRAAASVGVFTEQADGAFALTPPTRSMVTANPYSLLPLIAYSSHRIVTEPYRHLVHSLRTGEPAFAEALGTTFWQYLEQHPDTSEFFDATMTRLGQWETERHLDLIRPERFSRIADLGGGAGHFLAAALLRAADAEGVLVERPEVLDGARKQLADAGVEHRVDVRAGDLFSVQPLPADCDAYILKAVLHNWPDAAGRDLLGRLRAAIGDRGAELFIVEQVVAPGNTFDHAKFLDVDMLTLFGGVERDLPTWQSTLRDCGFELSETPDTGRWTVLCCRPV